MKGEYCNRFVISANANSGDVAITFKHETLNFSFTQSSAEDGSAKETMTQEPETFDVCKIVLTAKNARALVDSIIGCLPQENGQGEHLNG